MSDEYSHGKQPRRDVLRGRHKKPQNPASPEKTVRTGSSGSRSVGGESYQQLPGDSGTFIKGEKFICPIPDCPTVKFRTRIGGSPLMCDLHDQELKPDNSAS